VNAFLGELGKKLADRWLTLLVLPGLLYITVITVAGVLGQGHATDPGALQTWVDTVAAAPASGSPAGVLVGAVGILTGAAGAGLAATALGQLTQQAWTTQGRRAPTRWLTSWRRRRWNRAYTTVRTALAATARTAAARTAAARTAAAASPPPAPALSLETAVMACSRICLVEADRPTWIGDRLRAADERIHRTYRLDVSAAWPRLWLLIPETARTELSTAHDSYTAAARLAGWAFLYLVVAVWWWPALVIAAVTGVTAWIRARAAAVVLADLVETTVDLYGPELARRLGITCPGLLTPDIGHAVTIAVRKDDTLHPRDTVHGPDSAVPPGLASDPSGTA
jgi:hypothetical protein